jgi:S1-C subfamily serine protease
VNRADHPPAPRRRRWRPVLIGVLVLGAGLAGALAGRGTSPATTVTTTVSAAATTSTSATPVVAQDVTTLAASASQSVVGILATKEVTVGGDPFSAPTTRESVATGSGFVLDLTGRVVTAEHVIADATKIHVSFADGHKVHARLLAADALLDLAVLQVDVPVATLHPLSLGQAETLRVGQPVVAIGNPFGLDRSVSVGIVSALHRAMTAPNGFTVPDAIQTDAAVNHGNSGGPLLDDAGRVVGIADQIADSGVDANVGVAFAVSISAAARKAIAELAAGRTVRHAWLGASLTDIDAILGTSNRVAASEGALITGVVSGGPADAAGITGGSAIATVDGAQYCVGGDIVTSIDGTTVATAGDLQTLIAADTPGAVLTLVLVRADGSKETVHLTLGTEPATVQATTTGCG